MSHLIKRVNTFNWNLGMYYYWAQGDASKIFCEKTTPLFIKHTRLHPLIGNHHCISYQIKINFDYIREISNQIWNRLANCLANTVNS